MNKHFAEAFEKSAGLGKGLAALTGVGVGGNYAYSKYKDRNRHTARGKDGKFVKSAGPELWEQSHQSQGASIQDKARMDRQAILEKYEKNEAAAQNSKKSTKKVVDEGPQTMSDTTRNRQGRGW